MEKLDKIVKKHQDGATFNLFVTTESQSVLFPAGINRWRKCLEIKVCSPSIDNKANKDVIKTIANYFDRPVNDVFILKGSKNRQKTIYIKGLTVDFISDKLKESLDGF